MRTMIEANSEAFSKLIQTYDQQTGDITPTGRRYIQTSEFDKEWLKESKISKSCIVMPNYQACAIYFQDVEYFALIGPEIQYDELDDDILLEDQINAGLFTVLIAEMDIIKKRSLDTLRLKEEILSQHLSQDYSGIDFNDLKPFYGNISLFKVPSDSVFAKIDLYRIASYLFAKSIKTLTLEFELDTINEYNKVILEGSEKISFENIFNSLTSINWKHCYLEIYRNIERLFSVTYLKDLYHNLGLGITFFDFSAEVEKTMGWRPKEDEALEKLLSLNSAILESKFISLMPLVPGFSHTHSHIFIYKLRNAIVHYRPSGTEINIPINIWNEIIGLKLQVLKHIYNEVNAYI